MKRLTACRPSILHVAAAMCLIPVSSAQGQTTDRSAWVQVNALDTGSLEQYLKAFPDGSHATDAKKYLHMHAVMDDILRTKMSPKAEVITNDQLGPNWVHWKDEAEPDEQKCAGGIFVQPETDGTDSTLLGIFIPVGGSGTPAAMYVRPTSDTIAAMKEDVYTLNETIKMINLGDSIEKDAMRHLPPGLTPSQANFDWLRMPRVEGSIVGFITSNYTINYMGLKFRTPAAKPGDHGLVFGVLRDVGWVHLDGSGSVTLADGTVLTFTAPN